MGPFGEKLTDSDTAFKEKPVDKEQVIKTEQNQEELQQQVAKEGQFMLEGSLVAQRQDTANYSSTDFSSEETHKKIAANAKKSIDFTLDQKASYVTATSLAETDKLEKQIKALEELASKYSDNSLKKRKGQLADATALFAKMDEKKKEAEAEKDPYKKMDLLSEVIDLKAKALTLRAKAFGRDPGSVNDEIANIAIAANYEKLELSKRNIADDSKKKAEKNQDGIKDKVMHLFHHDKLEAMENKAKKNIASIADERRRHSNLEIFNAAYKNRQAELKDRDEKNRVKADVKKNADWHAEGMTYVDTMTREANGDTSSPIDSLLKESVVRKKAASKEADKEDSKTASSTIRSTLEIKGKVDGLIDSVKGCLTRVKNGKSVVGATSSDLSAQKHNIVKMCNDFLAKNKDKENSSDKSEQACYKYVKNIKEKLEKPANEAGSFTSGLCSVQRVLIDYRVKSDSFTDKNSDARWDLAKQHILKMRDMDDASAGPKGIDVLSDEKLKGIFGDGESVSLSQLKGNSLSIKAKPDGQPVKPSELKANVPKEAEKWEHADAAIAVDALLRVRGIHLENGPLDLMKAIPSSAESMQDVIKHYGKAMYGGNALIESKDLISRFLDADRFSLVHNSHVLGQVSSIKGDQRQEALNRVFGSFNEDVRTAITSGSAAAVFSSKIGKYITITEMDLENETYKVLDDSSSEAEAKKYTFKALFKLLFGESQVVTVEWIKDKTASGGMKETADISLDKKAYDIQVIQSSADSDYVSYAEYIESSKIVDAIKEASVKYEKNQKPVSQDDEEDEILAGSMFDGLKKSIDSISSIMPKAFDWDLSVEELIKNKTILEEYKKKTEKDIDAYISAQTMGSKMSEAAKAQVAYLKEVKKLVEGEKLTQMAKFWEDMAKIKTEAEEKKKKKEEPKKEEQVKTEEKKSEVKQPEVKQNVGQNQAQKVEPENAVKDTYVPTFVQYSAEKKAELEKDGSYDPYRDQALQDKMEQQLEGIVGMLKPAIEQFFSEFVEKQECTVDSLKKDSPADIIYSKLQKLEIIVNDILKNMRASGTRYIPSYAAINDRYIMPILRDIMSIPEGNARTAVSDRLKSSQIILEKTDIDITRFNKNHEPRHPNANVDQLTKEFFDQSDGFLDEDLAIGQAVGQNALSPEILLTDKKYDYIRGGENKLTYQRMVENRNPIVKKVHTSLSKLTVCAQDGLNCWACSTDVLLKSRGYEIEGGDKGVIKYLPDKIKTTKEAAKHYGVVAADVYSVGEQSELISKIVDKKKYALVHSNYNKPNKAAEDETIGKMFGEIALAVNNGSAVSIRIASMRHFVTIINVDRKNNKLTYLDSIRQKKETVQDAKKFLKDCFGNADDQKLVSLDWLMDKEKAKKKKVIGTGKDGKDSTLFDQFSKSFTDEFKEKESK